MDIVRVLLALAAKNLCEVHHLDVKSAFLNEDLQKIVYVSQPEGFVKEEKEHLVSQLIKALYRFRQTPHAWYEKLNRCLKSLGFVKCSYKHAIYTRSEGVEVLIIGVNVDNLLVTGTNVSNIMKLKEQMAKKFEISDLGKLSHYLVIEVDQ